MLSEDTGPQTVLQRVSNFLLSAIPIEHTQRTTLQNAVICVHYGLDYIILWALNATLLNNQTPPLSLTLPFFLARLICSLAFIMLRMPVFFAGNKLAIVLQLLVSKRQPLYQEVINVALEITMSGVWTLSKQQRMLHFDSRMGLRRAWWKQACVYGGIVGSNALWSQSGNKEAVFLLGVLVLMIWWVDSTEFYYNLNTQRYFVRIDQIIAVLYLATVLNDLLAISYQEYLFVSAALFLMLLVHLTSLPHYQPSLLTTPLSTLSNNQQREIAKYFLQVKTMLHTNSHEQLESFTLKIMQEVENHQLHDRLATAKNEGIDAERQAIDQFIIRELKRQSEHSPLLKDLLLYMYLPDRRVYSYLDLKNCHHRREYQRILSQKSVQFVNESYQANRQLQQTKKRLFGCSDLTRRFYRELMKERINLQRVLQLGLQYLNILHTFISENEFSFQRSPKASLLLTKYSQLCLPQYMAEQVAGNAEDMSASQEKDAQVVIGTEEDNVGLIIQVNTGFMKLASITRRVSQKQEFAGVVPKELHNYVQALMEDKCKGRQAAAQESSLDFAWIINSLGNVVCCSWRINQTFHSSQRCLQVCMVPIYLEKPILLTDHSGQMLGATELARYFGFAASSKSYRISQALLVELLQKERVHIKQGSNFVDCQVYAAPFDMALHLIKSVEVPLQKKKVYVIELVRQCNRDLLKTGTLSKEQPPVDFQFFFSWTGKITTLPPTHTLPLSDEEENRRIDLNYGESITEMRFFRGTIDYKSNFEREEEPDCPSLPRQLEENLPNIQEAQFYQKWHRKRGKTPTWLKLAVFLILLTVLISIGILTLFLINFNQFTQIQTTNLTYICKLYQKLQASIKLGTLTTYSQLGLSQNITQLINAQISLSSILSNDLYGIVPSAFSQASGQALLQQLNTLNLHINNFLQNSSTAMKNALTLVIQITPNFYNYLDALISIDNTQIASNSSLGVLLVAVVGVVVGVLVGLLWVLEYRLGQQENEIVEVLKSLDNDYLSVASSKAQKFKEIWLEENDVRDYEEEEAEGEEEKQNYSKHAISGLSVNLSKPLQVVWLAAFLLLLMLLRSFVEQLNATATQYASLTTYTFKHITALHTTWTLFNLNASQSAINAQINFTFSQEYKKILTLRDIAVNPLVGLGPFYLDFWQRDGFCRYMSSQGCNSLLGLGTSEGGNVVVSFVSEQYDSYLNLLPNLSLIYSQPDVKKLGEIVHFYLDESINANAGGSLEDFNRIMSSLWGRVVVAFSFSNLTVLLFLLFILYYTRLHRHHQRHQQILMLIPFSKLKTLPAFHRFYNKRLAST